MTTPLDVYLASPVFQAQIAPKTFNEKIVFGALNPAHPEKQLAYKIGLIAGAILFTVVTGLIGLAWIVPLARTFSVYQKTINDRVQKVTRLILKKREEPTGVRDISQKKLTYAPRVSDELKDEAVNAAEEKMKELFRTIETLLPSLSDKDIAKWTRDIRMLPLNEDALTPNEHKLHEAVHKLRPFIFRSFKTPEPYYGYYQLIFKLRDDIQKREGEWEKIKENVLKAHQEVAHIAPHLFRHPFTWFHGTSSGTLPGIFKMVLPGGVPSLTPSGILLRQGFAPLTGEILMGVTPRGINQGCLSGVYPDSLGIALRYARDKSMAFSENSALTRVLAIKPDSSYIRDFFNTIKILVLRLFLTKTSSEMRTQTINHLSLLANALPEVVKRDDWREGLFFLGQNKIDLGACSDEKAIQLGSVVFVKGDDGQETVGIVTAILSDGEYAVCRGKDIVQGYKKGNLTSIAVDKLPKDKKKKPSTDLEEFIFECMLSERERLEMLLTVIRERFHTHLPFNERDEEMFKRQIPLVFGSHTAHKFARVFSDVQGEIALEGAQELGKDIQVLFCPKEETDYMRKWLNDELSPYKVKVYVLSFDAASYLVTQACKRVAMDGSYLF